VQSDAGKEFLGAPFQQMLRERGIKFFTTPSNTKASMAERLIRTLRERMMRFFRATRSSNHWYGAMHQFQRNYNQSPHRSLAGFTPAQVHASPLLQGLVWNYIYRQVAPREAIKFRAGDRVRIGRWKGAFEKGYSDRWSVKIYTIHSVLDHHNPPMYRLIDPAVDELIEGAFNQAELQLVRVDDEEEERGENWQIESVLDVERRGGRGEDWQYFVKWVNQPSYMNQWVSESELDAETRRLLRDRYKQQQQQQQARRRVTNQVRHQQEQQPQLEERQLRQLEQQTPAVSTRNPARRHRPALAALVDR
jgi:hypothetical protein